MAGVATTAGSTTADHNNPGNSNNGRNGKDPLLGINATTITTITTTITTVGMMTSMRRSGVTNGAGLSLNGVTNGVMALKAHLPLGGTTNGNRAAGAKATRAAGATTAGILNGVKATRAAGAKAINGNRADGAKATRVAGAKAIRAAGNAVRLLPRLRRPRPKEDPRNPPLSLVRDSHHPSPRSN